MPATVDRLVAVERLATAPGDLPAEVARALAEDLEYARFGAALLDLPYYGALGREALRLALGEGPAVPPFARLLHGSSPVAFGLKLAELVARGALVGREPGVAVVTGYFVHLMLDRALAPLEELLVPSYRRPGEAAGAAQRRLEWAQAMLWIRDATGKDLLGTPDFAARCRVVKRRGLPVRGIGRGLYELVRTACADVHGPAPAKRELDGWVRGLYLFGQALSTPLARRLAPFPEGGAEASRIYRGEGVDVPNTIATALERARAAASRLGAMIARGDFGPRAKGRFLAEVPEGPLLGPA